MSDIPFKIANPLLRNVTSLGPDETRDSQSALDLFIRDEMRRVLETASDHFLSGGIPMTEEQRRDYERQFEPCPTCGHSHQFNRFGTS